MLVRIGPSFFAGFGIVRQKIPKIGLSRQKIGKSGIFRIFGFFGIKFYKVPTLDNSLCQRGAHNTIFAFAGFDPIWILLALFKVLV